MRREKWVFVAAAFVVGGLAYGLHARSASAHCDQMDGPVIVEARTALESGELAPVLKWIPQRDEAEIRAVFNQARAVRAGDAQARELADRFFFETLVRIHRAGEGAAYTGLKPAGTFPGPGVELADKALADGSVDALVTQVTKAVEDGIRERYARTSQARRGSERDVAAGRAYVAAYVDYVHYVKGIVEAAQRAGHGAECGAHPVAAGDSRSEAPVKRVAETDAPAACPHHKPSAATE